MKAPDAEIVLEIVRRTRLEQGLPPKISGSAMTARLATLISTAERRQR